jgi:endonuclease YncB( thermonuclease family)
MPSRSHSLSPHGASIAALLSILLLAFSAAGTWGQRRQHGEQQACQLAPGGESIVLAIAGPQTLRLADGRFVRLAEVLTPSAVSGAGYDPSAAATAFLRSAALGRKVEVKFGGAQRDRYGVYTAHVFVAGEHPFWLQEGLVSAGLAQAFPQADNSACSRELASSEVKARLEKRGHWGDALFKVLPAQDTRSISNLLQTYQVVEGKIARITQAGGRAIVHFSEETKFGFTAVIEPAAYKRLEDQNLMRWQGRFIRMRGWIERKKGPTMTITQPEQIELADDDGAPGASR